jgi:hypothetical protein
MLQQSILMDAFPSGATRGSMIPSPTKPTLMPISLIPVVEGAVLCCRAIGHSGLPRVPV